MEQLGFFQSEMPLPDGFRYEANVISATDERELLEHMPNLAFRDFEFHGYLGKRRVISFGWRYDFNERALEAAEALPAFLLPAREKAARFAGRSAEDFVHALVTEYGPGAAIGWHRDKAEFGDIVGISLMSPCQFRLRRAAGAKWERVTITAEPRSAYILSGAARTVWEHSIPAVDALRYSITFRTLATAPR